MSLKIDYDVMKCGMITYIETGKSPYYQSYEELVLIYDRIKFYHTQIGLYEKDLQLASEKWQSDTIWDEERREPVLAKSQEEYEKYKRSVIGDWKQDLEDEEKSLQGYKDDFDKYMDGRPYDWDKEFEKYKKWRDFLEKAEEVEEELDL